MLRKCYQQKKTTRGNRTTRQGWAPVYRLPNESRKGIKTGTKRCGEGGELRKVAKGGINGNHSKTNKLTEKYLIFT